MLKARRDGYDGRGNVVVRDGRGGRGGLRHARLAGARRCSPKRSSQFERELAVAGRARPGRRRSPSTRWSRRARIRRCTSAAKCSRPRAVSADGGRPRRRPSPAARSRRSAGWARSASSCSCCPTDRCASTSWRRGPHNSAHYTHRGVLDVAVRQPRAGGAAVCRWATRACARRPRRWSICSARATRRWHGDDLAAALAEPHAYVHLYGKAENRPGRKMGHVTALGATLDEALEPERQARRRVGSAL